MAAGHDSPLPHGRMWMKPARMPTTPRVFWEYIRPRTIPVFSIAANHCYSILGVYQNAGNNYVVLRNPWGYSDPTSPALTLGPGPWIYVNRLFDTSGNPDHRFRTVTFDFTLADGIFALEASQFASYFYGFGFVHM